MKKIKMALIFLLTVGFIFFPMHPSDIYIKVHFRDVVEGTYDLFYATENGVFTAEQKVTSSVENNKNGGFVKFRLDGTMSEKLTGLRLDLPAGEHLICVSNISVSSAGVIKKQFAPCSFFADENIETVNHIKDISLVYAGDIVYIATNGIDPNIVMAQNIAEKVKKSSSRKYLTRLLICIYCGGCYWLYGKRLFVGEK